MTDTEAHIWLKLYTLIDPITSSRESVGHALKIAAFALTYTGPQFTEKDAIDWLFEMTPEIMDKMDGWLYKENQKIGGRHIRGWAREAVANTQSFLNNAILVSMHKNDMMAISDTQRALQKRINDNNFVAADVQALVGLLRLKLEYTGIVVQPKQLGGSEDGEIITEKDKKMIVGAMDDMKEFEDMLLTSGADYDSEVHKGAENGNGDSQE